MAGMYFGYQWLAESEGQDSVRKEKSHALSALPIHSPFIFSIDDLSDFASEVLNDDNATSPLKTFTPLKPIFSLLQNIDSLDKKGLSNVFTNPVFISTTFVSREEVSYVIASSMTTANAKKFESLMGALFQDINTSLIRSYAGAEIRRANFKTKEGEQKTLFFSYTKDGLLLICDNEIMLEASIRQLKEKGIFNDKSFENIFSLSNSGKSTTLFINYSHLPQYIAKYGNTDKNFWNFPIKEHFSFLSNYGKWGELELDINEDELALRGLSISDHNVPKYIDAFVNQSSAECTPSAMIPDNCACFISLNVTNVSTYQDNYRSYLKNNSSDFSKYESITNLINKESGKDVKYLLNSTLSGELTQSFYINDSPDKRPKTILSARLKDKSSYEKWLDFAEGYKKDTAYTHEVTKLEINSGDSYSLVTNPNSQIITTLLGPLFTNLNAKYFTRYGDYICFFENLDDARRFLSAVAGKRTLHNNANYKALNNSSDKYNIFFYLNNTQGLFPTFLNTDIAKTIESDGAGLASKYRYFTWQMSSDNGVCYNTLSLRHIQKLHTTSASEWVKVVPNPLSSAPSYVSNHTHITTKDIVYANNDNVLHYLDATGSEEWTKQLDGKIIGNIQQLDYYGNNKWQVVVMTDKSVDIIDRLGNSVKGFPKKLPTPAASGLSIFDYDNKKDYRLFYTTKDGDIILCNKDFTKNKGWDFTGKIDGAGHELQFLRNNNKDYLITLSNNKLYILNRKGATRVETPKDLKYSNNPPYIVGTDIYATSEDGKIIKHKLDGTSETLDIEDFSKEHYFAAFADINSNIRYVFAEGKVFKIFNAKGERIKREKYNKDISSSPKIYRLKDGRVLISFTTEDGKVHISNSDGEEISGSPFEGSKYYYADFIDSETNDLYLLTGNDEPEIILYKIQN